MADLGRILAELARSTARGGDDVALADRLCAAAARLLGCDGGAITLAWADEQRLTLTATDATADEIESRQEVVQQGPAADAYRSAEYRSTVVEPGPERADAWPLLDLRGVDDGHPVVVHAVPMRVGRVTVGVLTLWQRGRRSTLDPHDAQIVAGVVAAALVHEVDEEDGALAETWARRSELHQAVGFVVAQLGVRPDDALALVRASAYVRGSTMTRTARDIIERRLTLSGEPDEESGTT